MVHFLNQAEREEDKEDYSFAKESDQTEIDQYFVCLHINCRFDS